MKIDPIALWSCLEQLYWQAVIIQLSILQAASIVVGAVLVLSFVIGLRDDLSADAVRKRTDLTNR